MGSCTDGALPSLRHQFMKVETSKSQKNLVCFIAETADDIFTLGQLERMILGAQKGFTLECKISLLFEVDQLTKVLLTPPEPCPCCT